MFNSKKIAHRWVKQSICTFGFFILLGAGTSAWISRLPSIRTSLHLQPSGLALITIIGGLGSLIGLFTSGLLTGYLGIKRSMTLVAIIWLTGMVIISISLNEHSVIGIICGLVATSSATSLWGTAMNVDAGATEQRVGKSIMPLFHASYSLGMLVALALGSWISYKGVSASNHIMGSSITVFVILIACATMSQSTLRSNKVNQHNKKNDGEKTSLYKRQLHAWIEPLVLLLAVINIALETSENAANDWTAIGINEAFQETEAVAALAPTIFAACMIITRFTGPWIISLLGNRKTLIVSLAVSAVGSAIFSLSPFTLIALFGMGVWGVGAALGVPIVMTMATKDSALAAQRTSVIATVNYGASWIIPPALGFLADSTGAKLALLPVSFALIIAIILLRIVNPQSR